jgi:hypothetical protein
MRTCQDFVSDLIAIARDERISAETEEAVLEHVESCSGCSRRLAIERQLTQQLAALKETDQHRACVPDHLESALLMEFRKATHPVQGQKRLRARQIAVVAALTAAVLLLAATGRLLIRHAPSLPAKPMAVAPVLSAPYQQKESVSQRKLSRASAASRTRAHRVQRANEEPLDFFVLPYAPSLEPHEKAEIYRVRVPRATLSSFGVLPDGRLDESMEADLVVGSDGVARAIRFIR